VGLTDAFMEAVKAGSSYDLIDPREKKKVTELDAAEVYESLVYNAWRAATRE